MPTLNFGERACYDSVDELISSGVRVTRWREFGPNQRAIVWEGLGFDSEPSDLALPEFTIDGEPVVVFRIAPGHPQFGQPQCPETPPSAPPTGDPGIGPERPPEDFDDPQLGELISGMARAQVAIESLQTSLEDARSTIAEQRDIIEGLRESITNLADLATERQETIDSLREALQNTAELVQASRQEGQDEREGLSDRILGALNEQRELLQGLLSNPAEFVFREGGDFITQEVIDGLNR